MSRITAVLSCFSVLYLVATASTVGLFAPFWSFLILVASLTVLGMVLLVDGTRKGGL